MKITCNICGSNEFIGFGVQYRHNAQCINCSSLERHRALHYLLNNEGLLSAKKGSRRCLQLAPEKVTHDYLVDAYGPGYTSADLFPEKYDYAKCLKLRLPEGFEIFPNDFFDLIIHNHVLEHIPGCFKSHINEFHRLLTPGGIMAFTIPDYRITKGIKETIEGGEFLPSNEDRLKIHGQVDHYKTFGADLIDYLTSQFSEFTPRLLNNCELSDKIKLEHNAFGIVFWCKK